MTYWLKIRGTLLAAALVAGIMTGCSSSLPSGGGTGGSVATGGSGGTGTGGVLDAGGDGTCHDYFYGGVPAACCPEPAPDCSDKPDGYPGYHCVSRDNQYCSCACQSAKWTCAC